MARKFVLAALASWTVVLAALMVFLFASIVTGYFATADINYTPALDKAKDAFLVQSGLSDNINKLQMYGERTAKDFVYKYIPSTVVNPVLLSGYFAYKRQITVKPFRSPVVPGAKQSFSLTPNQALLVTVWEF